MEKRKTKEGKDGVVVEEKEEEEELKGNPNEEGEEKE